MGRQQVTWEQFKDRLVSFSPVLLNPEVKFNYRSGDSKVRFTCPECSREFSLNRLAPIWWGSRNSCGCLIKKSSTLANSTGLTFGQIKDKLTKLNIDLLTSGGDTEVVLNSAKLGAYKFKCKLCDSTFGDKFYLYKVLKGASTCLCVKKEHFKIRGFNRRGVTTPAMVAAGLSKKGKRLSKSHYDNLCKAAKNRYNVSYFEIAEQLLKVGAYPINSFKGVIKTTEQIECCCSCKKIFRARALDIKLGMTRSCGCLKSYPEAELFEFVKSIASDAERNKFGIIKYYDGSRRQLDIWIPSKKFAIELDSSWHGESILRKRGAHPLSSYHKYLICKENGIRLMTIYADEWINKRDIIKGYINAILGIKKSVGARKCQAMDGGRGFIKQYHIQGEGSGITYSLEYNDNTVAAATFKLLTGPRAAGLKDVFTLTRYCVNEISVIGGLSKLIKHFWLNNPNAKTIVSFSDNRLSVGELYIKAGFIKLEENEPSYYYYVNRKRCDKSAFRKDSLKAKGWLREGETEWQCMQRLGYDRVWDCGKTKWVLDRPVNL